MNRAAMGTDRGMTTEQLELFHWFVRAHLEDQGGQLQTSGETTEAGAARAAHG